MKKIYHSILVSIAFVLFAGVVSVVQAATLTAGPLAISYDGDEAIFSELNIAPGNEYVKPLTVTNNGTLAHSFAISTTNVTGELADHIYIEPEENGNIIWSLTIYQLSTLPEKSQTIIPSINPGDSVALNLKARFDSSETSEMADKTVNFDFIFGTQEAEPTATVTDTAGTTDLITTGLIGGTFGTFTGTGVAPATTPTITATASPSGGGEVLGAKDDESKSGLNGLLLLIPPVALVLSVPFVTPGARNVVLPVLGGGTTAVLSFFTHGSFTPIVFWSILIAEMILILVLDYFIVKKTVIEVLEEEEVLEKKARRAHSKKRR